jgi:hypothetical protein
MTEPPKREKNEWDGFRAEVIDRLARIETKLDSLPCQRHQEKIDRLEANQGKYMALTIAIVIVISIIFSIGAMMMCSASPSGGGAVRVIARWKVAMLQKSFSPWPRAIGKEALE